MKKLILLFFIAISSSFLTTAQVGVGTNNPNASSALDISSTSRGLLIPRLTQSQRLLIASPAEGLMVYQTDAPSGFYFYNGTAWNIFGAGNSWGLSGNTGTNPSTNFIGTTDNQDFIFRTDGTEAIRARSNGTVGIDVANPSARLHIGDEAIAPPPAFDVIYEEDFEGTVSSNIVIAGGDRWLIQNTFFDSPNFGIVSRVGDQFNSDFGNTATYGGTFISANNTFFSATNVDVDVAGAFLTFRYLTFITGATTTVGTITNRALLDINPPGPGPNIQIELDRRSNGWQTFSVQLPPTIGIYSFSWSLRAGTRGVNVPNLFVVDDILVSDTAPTSPVITPMLRIADGAQDDGRVLTSDNAGNASWELPPTATSNLTDDDWGFLSGNTNADPIYRLLNPALAGGQSVRIGGSTFDDLLLHVQVGGLPAGTEIGLGSEEFLVDDQAEFNFSHTLIPLNDDAVSSGNPTNRWDTLVSVNGVTTTSDAKEKEDILPLAYGMQNLLEIEPVTYQWKKIQYGKTIIPKEDRKQKIGFLAQNLKQVIPEVVVDNHWVLSPETREWSNKKNEVVGVTYNEILPLVVKSVQEKQESLDAIKKQQKEIDKLLKELKD